MHRTLCETVKRCSLWAPKPVAIKNCLNPRMLCFTQETSSRVRATELSKTRFTNRHLRTRGLAEEMQCKVTLETLSASSSLHYWE